ncbi:MAG: DUF2314 domain-containing protein [Phenylobacterium sp.]|uniref:DUF2314 domain-containing protein n=1 Tax=Phenylobacterium sp. TaxID=1871053 RepID=UPI002735064B|nr:DUF2314 domain-containing protein [Phenylobacterium sp.]MDP3749315.1 DUF2314 domain-containing protein [Phenylobacterium sp.]
MSLHRLTGAVAGVVVAISAMPLLTACQRENFVVVSTGDPAATTPEVEARKTLPIFWSKVEGAPAGVGEFRLKIGLPTPNGAVEHIWTDLVSRSSEEIVGTIANDPVNLPDLKFGAVVRIDPETISDWSYVKGEKLYGAYTMRALLDRMPADERAEALALLSAQPLEAGAN